MYFPIKRFKRVLILGFSFNISAFHVDYYATHLNKHHPTASTSSQPRPLKGRTRTPVHNPLIAHSPHAGCILGHFPLPAIPSTCQSSSLARIPLTERSINFFNCKHVFIGKDAFLFSSRTAYLVQPFQRPQAQSKALRPTADSNKPRHGAILPFFLDTEISKRILT